MKRASGFNVEKMMILVDWLRQQGAEKLSGMSYRDISKESEKELGFGAPESTLLRIRTTPSFKITWETSKPYFDRKKTEFGLVEAISRLEKELELAKEQIRNLDTRVRLLTEAH